MATYSLACAQVRADTDADAIPALAEAIGLNPDLRAHAGRDPDLATLRNSGKLDALLAEGQSAR